MIVCYDKITKLEGSPKELTAELSTIVGSFKECLLKENNFTEEEATAIIVGSIQLGLMNNLERKEYLDNLTRNYMDEIEFNRL